MSTIQSLFQSDVTRDIPPVVYFHEQDPARLASEVSEYIVTGGWPEGHPHHRRVPQGIHEQYVRLLTGIRAEIAKPHGPDLPTCWISGFYGSGKSSFAKLLGLALDGVALPDGRSLTAAWLARDQSPRRQELEDAWTALRREIDPIAVVFDIGGVARDGEHVHSAVVRQLQIRLGYCATEPLVADTELLLERDGRWKEFLAAAERTLGQPWAAVRDAWMVADAFSQVLHAMDPARYPDPLAWVTSRAGTHTRAESPEEAVAAIGDMLRFRATPNTTLFLVVDEVSQYVLSSKDRVDRLRAFATALGARHRGKVWLLALGQQKLDEEADASFLVWLKDRFPARLQVHLHPTNIRDVVHRRLLAKTPDGDALLRGLFAQHRATLSLYAYGCDTATPDDFVETYPLLPGHVDLLLQLTSALRSRSSRAQGDDQAIRGLLQLLGELFRDQRLAELPVGSLVTLDRIYDVQHTALDADIQASMARLLRQAPDGWAPRVAKAVALLELIQDTLPTDAELVARCLYDRIDRGPQREAVAEALEQLRRENLLGYSEKTGYKIQSSAGEEWERERREIGVPREALGELVRDSLGWLLADPTAPRWQGRPFPWGGTFSDGRRADGIVVKDPRDDAAVRVDFQFLPLEERAAGAWVKRSDETALRNRLVWICGDTSEIEARARDLARSLAMIRKYDARRDSLQAARKLLLQQEHNRAESLVPRVREAVAAAWMAGDLYFRGRAMRPADHGASFRAALEAAGARVLPELFPHFVPVTVGPSELKLLLAPELSGPPHKFLVGDLGAGHLGLLETEGGRYVPSCSGVVPRRVLELVAQEGGVGGTPLLAHFGGPPFGWTPDLVKACVAGLLRGGLLSVQPESGAEITAVRDAGVQDLFDKDRSFRRSTYFPAGDDDIGVTGRNRVCRFFQEELGVALDREDAAIADAVADHFPARAARVRDVLTRLDRLPVTVPAPPELERLHDALEACLRQVRQTRPTVRAVKARLEVLREGVRVLAAYDTELTEAASQALRQVANVRDHALAQLRAIGRLDEATDAAARIEAHLTSARPWQALGTLDADLAAVRAVYTAQRTQLLATQEALAQEARARIKAHADFSRLTADQSHHVLRPIHEACHDTDAVAVAPPLAELDVGFQSRLRSAEHEAWDRLDAIRGAGDAPLVRKVAHGLKNREVGSEAEVDALLAELRTKLVEQIRTGARVRIVG